MTREEVIEWFRENPFYHKNHKPFNMAIKALQEPKTGRWTRVSMDKYVQHAMAYYRCSECGKDIIGEHNYCPNCGCRMVEPQERSDKE